MKMMKKGILTLVLFLMLLPGAAFAHTGLESAVPGNGDTVTSALDELVLTFETPIEPLSEIKVVNEEGKEMDLADIEVKENTLTAKLSEPLPNGAYKVDWTIVGEDGHTINNEYAFTVDAPVEPEQPDNTVVEDETIEADTPVTSEDTVDEQNNTAAPVADDVQETEAGNTGNAGIWIALIVVVIIAGAYVALRRKGKK
ncbi:copper resistance protein CopC [Paenibacillus sp. Sa2BVA9]|uniref:Copper resistance protein CopC n=2 Tax=Paenibacillus gallinarum TaxID=2762232 RepID=A0ABR8SZ98_9BACL|nr:copper resistance protein CopC [Paenibacillus gallinarum]